MSTSYPFPLLTHTDSTGFEPREGGLMTGARKLSIIEETP
jgi:hypothetical protein